MFKRIKRIFGIDWDKFDEEKYSRDVNPLYISNKNA